jgi:hypothetical protein
VDAVPTVSSDQIATAVIQLLGPYLQSMIQNQIGKAVEQIGYSLEEQNQAAHCYQL